MGAGIANLCGLVRGGGQIWVCCSRTRCGGEGAPGHIGGSCIYVHLYVYIALAPPPMSLPWCFGDGGSCRQGLNTAPPGSVLGGAATSPQPPAAPMAPRSARGVPQHPLSRGRGCTGCRGWGSGGAKFSPAFCFCCLSAAQWALLLFFSLSFLFLACFFCGVWGVLGWLFVFFFP